MANTFIELNDTPSEYDTNQIQFVITAGNELDFVTLSTNELIDVNTFGAYKPVNGQVLQYFGGAGEWRPGVNDPYSAGNGLNKSGQTLNVQILPDGGLFANASGIFIETITNVEGTYGNATHVPVISVNSRGQVTGASFVEGQFEVAQSLAADHVTSIVGTPGQITVAGGTGIASNATLNLVATGVTAAVYGNTTHLPQITVDTYGRIQNVDMVEVTTGNLMLANGNVSISDITVQAYRNIVIPGATTLSADRPHDTLTIEAGDGIAITSTASSDTITISNAGTDITDSSIGDLADVDMSGITGGQVLAWNEANAQFQATTVTGGGGGTPTGISVVTAAAASGGSLVYNNLTGVFTFRPADLSNFISGDTGVTVGTYGTVSTVPQFTVDAQGRISNVTEVEIGRAGGYTTGERFRINYAADGSIVDADEFSVGINHVNIDSSSGGEISVVFKNSLYNFPPSGILVYGYDYNNNKYIINQVDSTMSLREVEAGGTFGAPTLFDGTNTVTVRLRVREAETGASRGSFGTTTHAWLQFVMNG